MSIVYPVESAALKPTYMYVSSVATESSILLHARWPLGVQFASMSCL